MMIAAQTYKEDLEHQLIYWDKELLTSGSGWRLTVIHENKGGVKQLLELSKQADRHSGQKLTQTRRGRATT